MANYYGTARTNYFRVKDLARFQSEALELPITMVTKDPMKPPYPEGTAVALLASGADSDGWPSYLVDDYGEPTEIDFVGWIASHLVDGDVAVLQEVGAEKLRYLTGYSIAVNSQGERECIGIDDIYAKAAKLGDNITRAIY